MVARSAATNRGSGAPGGPRIAVDPRHGGRANVVYCDGHAGSLTPDELGYAVNAAGTYAAATDDKDPDTTNDVIDVRMRKG